MLILKLTVMFPHTWTFGSLKPRLNLPKERYMLCLLYFKLIYMIFYLIFYFLVQNRHKTPIFTYLLSRQTTHSTLVETTKGIFMIS